MSDILIQEINSKLSGVIWRKALLDNNFEKVYSRVFEELVINSFDKDTSILEIFGNVTA